MQNYLPQLKFAAGSKIADLTLLSKVHSTLLYETWNVLKQEKFVMKPYLAHIYKYTLGSTFPMKSDDLDHFCQKIESYNKNMLNENIRAIPCYNSTSFNQKIPGGILSYLLFENPNGGYKLADICTPQCSKERICRYMLKDFIRGFMRSIQFSQLSSDMHDVNFVLAQNGFFFGKVPEVKKLSQNSGDISMKSAVNQKESEPFKDENRHFISLAYPKAWSAEGINSTKLSSDELKKIKNKQFMTQFGRFIIDMYKGLDNSTNVPASSPDDNFNPAGHRYANLTEVYLDLNTEKDGNYSKFRADDYFGIKSDFVTAVQAFLANTLTSQKAFKEMDDMLLDSFYDFIYKTVTFDISSKIQFEDFDKLLNHKFLMNQIAFNKVRSDTSFER
jgi:hypothetical protein